MKLIDMDTPTDSCVQILIGFSQWEAQKEIKRAE